jgi:molybdopterin/thiamine biosynthesis adenylyltransferase
VHPRLKGLAWQREGDELRLVYDIREQFVLADPDGVVEALLHLLEEGGRTPAELAGHLTGQGMAVSPADIGEALALFDSHGLVEDGDGWAAFSHSERERYHSNLAFFESFATLGRGRADLQRDLRDAHVLVLGTGGLNSNTIPHLCGLGVGRLTLLDRDNVESRNFARQYLYKHADIGSPKVEVAADWVRAFDPTVKTEAVSGTVGSAADVAELLDRFRPDLVMCGVDQPLEVGGWVNAACVAERVPFVRAGMRVTTGLVMSVDPGRSGCFACIGTASELSKDDAAAAALYKSRTTVNRGIGPIAGLLGSLAAFEMLRYLTGFEPPAYAGRQLTIDFAHGCEMTLSPWEKRPDCPDCGSGTDATPRGGDLHEDRDQEDRERSTDAVR